MDKKKALKKLQKLQKNLKNCKFEIIQNTLLSFGFEESQPAKGSSHYKYTKDGVIIVVPKRKPVREHYVKDVIEILEALINEQQP